MATEQAKQAKAPCNHPKLGPIWVNVHSEDDISKLPSRILKSTDRPRVAVTRDGALQKIMDDDAPMWFIHKMISGQTLYDRKDCPEAQFIKLLRARKDAGLKKRGEGDRAKRDYILKFGMHDINDDNNEDLIWRRIKVSGGMKLSVFQDKILNSVMGW
ncbi:hypothetical protein FPQ18DRAFT_395501 [Pyronema domesticum]|nr:hypothetical protein FPQ18DRAFT_395501 [Pyronema domesticum]